MKAGLHIQTVIDLKRYRIYHSRLPGMFNILEQILPTEIAMKVLTYSRHPVAEIMKPYHEKHDDDMIRYREMCNRTGKEKRRESFALHFHLEKYMRKGQQEGKTRKQVGTECRHMRNIYG